ncbi:MAG: hypothetical protein SF162_01525 [bacterium]|nr:hypothetical protein [bacterium]
MAEQNSGCLEQFFSLLMGLWIVVFAGRTLPAMTTLTPSSVNDAPVLEIVLVPEAGADPALFQAAFDVVQERLAAAQRAGQIGSFDATLGSQGEIGVQFGAGIQETDTLIAALLVTSTLEWIDFSSVDPAQYSAQAGTMLPPGHGLPVVVTNADVQTAIAGQDASNGSWYILVTLEPEAAERFAAFTAANIGSGVALVVAGEIISIPIIQTQIDSPVSINGAFTQAEAESLAGQIGTPALPVPLVLQSIGLPD